MLVPTELRRAVRLAIAATMVLSLLGPILDARAVTDLYPGAPAIAASASASVASIKSAPDAASIELAQIDNGLPVEIVAGPMPGIDGLLWYQVNVAGLIGFVAETDLAWGLPEAPEPTPIEAQIPPAVTGTGVVLSKDGSDIVCRAAPNSDADSLFIYASGSSVDLAGEPTGDWQPVVCAAQLGYLPAQLVHDPAAPSAPAPTEPAEPSETATPEATTGPVEGEILPEVTETVVVSEEIITSEPEVAITEDSETATPVESLPEVTETPIVEIVTEETDTSVSATPEIVDEITEPAPVVGTETASPVVEVTETVIAEVIDIAEPIGQTIDEGDVPVTVAFLSTAAVVYNTGAGGLRCRVAPSLESQVLLVLPLGGAVTLTGSASNGWQPVVCNGLNGFMAVRFLQPTDGGTIGQDQPASGTSSFGSTLVVQNTEGAGLRCRSAGNLTASIITVLPEGASLASRGAAVGEWQPVTCAGVAGWVHTEFVGSASSGGSSGGGTGGPSGSVSGAAIVANTDGAGVRFRASASFDSAVIAVLSEGASVTLRNGSIGSWTAVTYNGRNGFVYADYLTTARNPSTPGTDSGVGSTTIAAGSNARVTDTLNFRSSPSYSAGVIGIAAVGTVVRVTGAASNGFYPVKWGESTGYMHRDYLVYTTESLSTTGPNGGVGGNTGGGPGAGTGPGSTTGQSLVSYAMRYLGYPYIWATHGPNSFDCSGFTYWVVLNVTGRNIGAGTWTQWETGSPIPYGSLQPGDLVFFQNTYTVGLSHVGMYIGNDQFIHAENEDTGVRISSLTSTYYATRYLGARRM